MVSATSRRLRLRRRWPETSFLPLATIARGKKEGTGGDLHEEEEGQRWADKAQAKDACGGWVSRLMIVGGDRLVTSLELTITMAAAAGRGRQGEGEGKKKRDNTIMTRSKMEDMTHDHKKIIVKPSYSTSKWKQ